MIDNLISETRYRSILEVFHKESLDFFTFGMPFDVLSSRKCMMTMKKKMMIGL